MSKLTCTSEVVFEDIIASDLFEKPVIFFTDELAFPAPVLPEKRFGINDLWKIHSGKRYANVYPRRAE